MKHCIFCDGEIGDLFYHFDDYVYKLKVYNQKTKKCTTIYFCSWTCYRRYLNERKRQNKFNNFSNEVY